MLFSPSGKKSHIFARVGLTLALVINLTLPAFASDLTSGSAFAVDERLLAVPRLAASASAPVGSSTDPFYVKPYNNGKASMYRYSWSSTNTNGSTSGINVIFTNFADIITHITNSIAQSVYGLANRLHYDNDAIYGRLYNILSSIPNKADVSSIATDMQTLVNSGIAVDFKSFIPYFIPDENYNFSGDAWRYWWTPYIDGSGNWVSSDVYDTNFLLAFKNTFLRHLRTTSYVGGMSVSGVRSSDSVLELTSPIDLSVSNTGSGNNAKSIWYDLRALGSNLSSSLARLSFVLANPDDIALRQTQHDNMQTVKNDFTSGDVSVSPAKLGGLKSVGSALTDGLSSSASVSDGLSVLGSDSDAWSWFSEENAQAFDSVSGSRNMRMLKSGTSYLDQYYKDVMPYVN